MLCVLILYISGGTYSLKSTPNDRFEKLFTTILFTLRVFARNLLRGNRRRNTFRISSWCLAWDSNPGFSSNKPTHYLLDHGDFNHSTNHSISFLSARNISIFLKLWIQMSRLMNQTHFKWYEFDVNVVCSIVIAIVYLKINVVVNTNESEISILWLTYIQNFMSASG